MLVASLVTAAAMARALAPLVRHAIDKPKGLSPPVGGLGDLAVLMGVVLVLLGWTLQLAWPALLPTGRGSDLTHHLLLTDYIERHWRLVHDPALAAVMGEMAHYTPGSHLLAALAGAWSGTNALRAFYPLLAVCATLTGGFVFLIARRLLPTQFALISVMLLLLPLHYFVGAFTHDGFLAQAVSSLFAVFMWWAIVVWDEQPSRAMAAVIGLAALGVFLAWPVWIGPPLLVFAASLLRGGLPGRERVQHAAVALAPVMIVAAVYAAGRLEWVQIVRASGGALAPSIETVGWAFPVLAVAGLAVATTDRRTRITLGLLIALGVQAATLWLAAKANGASTPYLAYKMTYLAIYPLAVLGALAIGRLLAGADARAVTSARAQTAGWVMATILMVTIVRPAFHEPRVVPIVSIDLYQAGQWARDNVGADCVDYLVDDANTAYWLHLAVLGNARASSRAAEIERYEPRAAMGHWIASDQTMGYAIIDERLMPDELSSRVEVIARFGSAALIMRPGAKPCLSR
ncbi:MAG: hypothetical protein Q7R30_20985 [Acidobacteriota bacterium]|nr:hypothetical protein [Acidobacteriota bacterium]